MRQYKRFLVLALCLLLLLPALTLWVQAKDLDEIVNYTVTVDVNEDATLHMVYHIDWKVLDSDSEGPLEWVKIGVPNSHHSELKGLSSAVRRISGMSENGETYARIDLDRSYYAGEVANIEFELTQDYLYQVDMLAEGETVYRLTPGWFDDIKVDGREAHRFLPAAQAQTGLPRPSCVPLPPWSLPVSSRYQRADWR